jgi:hypothetical protein
MGYSYDGSIKNYWPDNDENTFYITGEWSISQILEMASNHFGRELDISEIYISSEYIHTHCLTYDCYDPSDYTCFTVIKLYK